MNYKKTYDKLINNAIYKHRRRLDRSNSKYVYYEKHHIIPRCLGGLNNVENLVLLTAKEHFVAHKLLVEVHPKEKGLIYTVRLMTTFKSSNRRNYKVGAREYKRYKLEVFEMLKNKIVSEETKLKLSNSAKGRKLSEETKLKIKQSVKKRPPISQETRERIRISSLNKRHTEESKEKMRQAQKRIKRETITCPYCNRSGGVPTMIHYHFDNCKENPKYVSKLELLTCPHCGFENTSKVNMKRWHFDNCKKYRNL